MKSSKSTLAVAVLLSVMGTGAFAAEQADKTYYFDEVVVTASGRPETLFTTKSNTQVITSEQIEKMHYKDVKEALRQTSGMRFADYPGAGQDTSSKFGMNGSNKVKIMVNGMPVSVTGADNMGTPQSYVSQLMNDMDAIERIEVVKGSGSLLYGTDAVGGVINIVTKKIDGFKTTVGIEGGNFGHEQYKLATQGKFDKTSYRIFAQKYHDGKFEDGNGDDWKSRKNGHSENISLNHEFSEGNSISLDYRHGEEDFSRMEYLYGYSPTDNTYTGKTKVTNLQFRAENKLNEKIANKLFYNYTKYENNDHAKDGNYYYIPSMYWDFSNADSEMHNNYKTSNIKDLFTYTNKDNVLTFGAEYVKSEELRGSRESLENKAVFLQDNWKFGKGWDLTVAGRYDKPTTSGKADIDDNFAKSINLGYKFSEKSNMYIGYNDYFVLPSISMLYNYSDGDLKPEKGKNYEIGFNHKFTENDVVSAHYFIRKSEQMITSRGWGADAEYYNLDDDTKVHGFDVQYDKTFDGHWHAKLGWACISTEEPQDYVLYPKNQFTLGVDYTADKWNVGLDARAFVGAGGKNFNYASVPQGGHYMLMDLALNYHATKDVKVYAKVNNLFDKYYADQFDCSGYVTGDRTIYARPGRTFIVGMNWSF